MCPARLVRDATEEWKLPAGGQNGTRGHRAKETVWEWAPADTPAYRMTNLQLATRLANGNTIINNWFNQWSDKTNPATAPIQAIEVTPDKKVVWALRSWTPPADLDPPPRFNSSTSLRIRKTSGSATSPATRPASSNGRSPKSGAL